MHVEHFLSIQADLDGATKQDRGLAHDHLVVAHIALAAEAAAVRRRDPRGCARREALKHAGEQAVHVVRHLGRRPERELAFTVNRGDGCVLLDRRTGVAFVEEKIFEDVICSFQRFVDVAELERLQPVDVAELAVGMDAQLGVLERLDRIEIVCEKAAGTSLPPDRTLRLQSARRAHHCRDRVADVAHMLRRKRVFVLAHRQNAEGHQEILARKHEVDARVRFRFCDVDRLDERVRLRAAQELHVQHARQRYVVGEARLTRHLGAPVDAAARFTENLHRAFSSPRLRSLRRSAGSRCSGRVPEIASLMRSREGSGSFSRRAFAVMRMPGVQ